MKRKFNKKSPFFFTILLSVCCLFLLCACQGEENVWMQSQNEGEQSESGRQTEDVLLEGEGKADAEEENRVVIHILGAVNCPGVYELPAGSRMTDAIESAGGYTAQACISWLNQARLLEDGEQIYVPTDDEVKQWRTLGKQEAPTQTDWSAEQSAETKRININRATVQELMNLPGIGEAKAKSIVDYRQQNGDFNCVEDLMLVPGIKEGVYNQIKDYIQV